MVKQERALRTRRALVRAAAEVFAGEGFAPASLTAISRRAGVSNGALHFHFPNKKALARAVEEEALETVRGITGRMSDAWVTFARTGAAPSWWPPFDDEGRRTWVFDREDRLEEDPRAETRAAWRSWQPYG